MKWRYTQLLSLLTYVTVEITGVPVAKAAGLGHGPVNYPALGLRAGKCQLMLLTTSIARYVTSNASSRISSRWCMQCDNTAYVITGTPFWFFCPINRYIRSLQHFLASSHLASRTGDWGVHAFLGSANVSVITAHQRSWGKVMFFSLVFLSVSLYVRREASCDRYLDLLKLGIPSSLSPYRNPSAMVPHLSAP